MMTRGAGDRDSRELTLALDNLGLDRRESVGLMHTGFSAATVASNLPGALEIYADLLRRPHLPEEELEAVQSLALQDLLALEDDPRGKVLLELRKRHYPPPLSNDHRGVAKDIEKLTIKDLKKHHTKLFRPKGSILSVAGNIDWSTLVPLVGKLFGDWHGGETAPLALGSRPANRGHLTKELEQTQIALAYASVPLGHADYYDALGAVNVLSGSMSSRLFTEIREKEGLCYHVAASYQMVKDRGSVIGYAASSNDRAQRTLDLFLRELGRLADGIEAEEVERVQAGLKSSLIMQQESTYSRALSLASDWYYLGRVRTFDEVQAAINALTPQSIVEHVRRYPPGGYTIVTLGPKPLTIPG
jgi:predicted Zn-dependent peptidase